MTIQAGQCGNQVGLQYWNQLAQEHAISSDGERQLPSNNNDSNGVSSSNNNSSDHPELFFHQTSNDRYTPRSVMIDLEPSVINKCTNTLPMINPRNIHVSEQGNGAGNNWLNGYSYGSQNEDELLNLIDRECDKCDNLNNLQLIHSVAGGTGAGIGSFLLEALNDRYGTKKLKNTFLIFPSSEGTSDVVVQPYNTMLTLKRLIDYSDATVVFDNDALTGIENMIMKNTGSDRATSAFHGPNKLIAMALASISNPIRFPGYMYSSYELILSTLVPTPDLKFLSAAIAPVSEVVGDNSTPLHSMNEYDLVLELLDDKYKMNRVSESVNYISMLTYLIGAQSQQEIRKGIIKAQGRVQFVPWTSSSVHIVSGHKPYSAGSLTGVQISNNSSIASMFTKVVKQFDRLAQRGAYINNYTESNDAAERARVLDIFAECKESVLGVIDEYRACQDLAYLDDI